MTEAQVALREGRLARMADAPRAAVREDVRRSPETTADLGDDELGHLPSGVAAEARGRPGTALPRRGPDLGWLEKPRLLEASFGSLAVSNTAISMLKLSLALRLRGAGIVFPAIGHGAVQIAPATRQRGVENDSRDA